MPHRSFAKVSALLVSIVMLGATAGVMFAEPASALNACSPGVCNVDHAGSDATGDGTAGNPWKTIAYAMTQIASGDTLFVHPGTWTEQVNVNVPGVTIEGDYAGLGATPPSSIDNPCNPIYTPPSFPRAGETVLSGPGGNTPLTVSANGVTVDGFMIQGGTNPNNVGGGVYLAPGTHGTTLENNDIQGNILGVFLANNLASSPTVVRDNRFADNTQPGAASGNDIYADNSTAGGPVSGAVIDSNCFTNTSFVEGTWAIDMSNVGAPQFSNITVSNNKIDNHGRGVLFFGTKDSAITSNTITPGALNHYSVLLCGNDPSCVPGISNTNISVTLNKLGGGSAVGKGAWVLDAGGTSSGLLINRNDLQGVPVGIESNTPTNVNGLCNWWGAPTGPGAGQKVGTVNASTWLTAASPLATAPCAGAPGAPTITTVTSAGPSSVSVAFTPGPDNGSPITSFTATCVSLIGQPTGTTTGPGSPLVVTGLSTGTPYTCTVTATNAAGTGPPSAPSNVIWPGASGGGGGHGCATPLTAPTTPSSAPGNASATVSWGPPPGGCFEGYVVHPYIGTTPQTPLLLPGFGTTTVVKGLTNGQTYTFTITAYARNVEGPASVHTTPITIGAPAKTSTAKVTRIAAHTLRVTFTAPANNGAPITRYTATCSSPNGGASKAKSGKASPIVVTGLTAGKTYTCTVRATNSRGTGPASRASSPAKA
jgi:hypothetical protein